MGYNIRPLSFGEVLDRAFAIWRDHFWLIVGSSAAVFIPFGVWNGLVQVVSGSPTRALAAFSFFAYLLIAMPVMLIAVETAIMSVYLGRPVTISEAYRSTRPVLWRIVGTYLLSDVLLVISFIALIVPGVYLLICWELLTPVIVAENRFGMAALRRSRELVRGVWWRTLGIAIIATIISDLPAMALDFFWGHIPFLGPILNGAMLAVTCSYALVIFIVYYFDRRCRTEDFDLRLLAEQIRGEAETATQPMPGTSPIA